MGKPQFLAYLGSKGESLIRLDTLRRVNTIQDGSAEAIFDDGGTVQLSPDDVSAIKEAIEIIGVNYEHEPKLIPTM